VRTPALEKFSFERMLAQSLAVYDRFRPSARGVGLEERR
jgi:hypothetical protein